MCFHSTHRRFGRLWKYEMDTAFEKAKVALTSPPVLPIPDFKQLFILGNDTSFVSVGEFLSQNNLNGRVNPTELLRRTINNRELNCSSCDREALAVTFDVKKFSIYLLPYIPLILIKDHQALGYEFSMNDLHWTLSRWFSGGTSLKDGL